jgi:hypothetical protein
MTDNPRLHTQAPDPATSSTTCTCAAGFYNTTWSALDHRDAWSLAGLAIGPAPAVWGWPAWDSRSVFSVIFYVAFSY